MFIRIVKMTFKEENCEDFLNMFDSVKNKIRAFGGCNHLELLRDKNNPTIFMTYSYWESDEALENYRTSTLFRETWAVTKTYFDAKPEAWSVEQQVVLN